ncbi:MAG: hypothetical protein NTY19_06640 [Planctomycetota bacterium]|nr:hypothetical protein [Planctomycetota bacterium]
MPRKLTDEWLSDERGRYRRKVGWWIDDHGTRKQYPFHFGTNKDQACARYMRVKELWASVEEKSKPLPLGEGEFRWQPEEPKEPAWNTQTLGLARQLAAGRVQIVVERSTTELPQPYCQKIQHLAREYPFLHFVPDDPEAFSAGSDFLKRGTEFRLKEIRQMAPNVLPEVTETLHVALDAYVTDIMKNDMEPTPEGPTLTQFGASKIEQAKRLKQRHPDCPLSTLDQDGCQDLLDLWRMRPLTTDKRISPPRPMKKKTCENHVSELKRFLKWLHRSKQFGWRKPDDFDELRTNVKDIQEERTDIAHNRVPVYLPEELAVLNKYATPLERLLLLLGLNCGFKGAEQGTLLLDHIFLDRPHPNAKYLKETQKYECQPADRFILYKRNKTKVYGEFLLWPQTVEILQWAIERRNQICEKIGLSVRTLLVTERGTLFYRLTSGKKNQSQIFGNKWDALIKRIRKDEDHKDFPDYSFTSLRDTAADMIRPIAGGEIASVFLMHGKPVKEDDLLDIYSNRPFGRVFDALRVMQEMLKPMFYAVPQGVVEQPMQQYTPLSKREQIIELKRQDKNVTEIMAETGLSRMTIVRTLDRFWFVKGKPKQTQPSSDAKGRSEPS